MSNRPTVAREASPAQSLGAALDSVTERIAAACARAGRDPADVRVLPISKTVPVERLRAALDLGLTSFGENRVQEAEDKAVALPDARWELVGRLQSNKAARAVELFDAIHSVDSLDLATRLGRLAVEHVRAPYPIYLQVNVDADPAKSGFDAAALRTSASQIAAIEGIAVAGLMTVGRLVAAPDEARQTFTALRALSEALRSEYPHIGPGLSIGMSDDFEVAVEEGATILRLGRVLFGDRPAA